MRLSDAPRRTTRFCAKALILLPLLLTMAGCQWLTKPTTKQYVPPAGCGERSPALEPPPPENTTDWRIWRALYVGAVWAFTDSQNKRASTADCLDQHRRGK